MPITKKRKAIATKVDKNKVYSLNDASSLVKEVNCTKFDSSVDLHIRLGVDPKKLISRLGVLLPSLMELVKQKRCWFFVRLIRKQRQEKQVQILWV